MSPRSTYADIDRFTITGMDRKNRAPSSPYWKLIRLIKYENIKIAVKRAKAKWIYFWMMSFPKYNGIR